MLRLLLQHNLFIFYLKLFYTIRLFLKIMITHIFLIMSKGASRQFLTILLWGATGQGKREKSQWMAKMNQGETITRQ